jgi:hypothetical protein
LANNLAFANGCALHGGGIQIAGPSSGFGPNLNDSVVNNIAYANGGWGFDCRGMDSTSILENNDSSGNQLSNEYTNCSGPQQRGNVSANPAFVAFNANPAFPTISNGRVVWSNADYHLTTGSPMVGAGTSACAAGGLHPCIPTLDFEGNVRPSPLSIGPYDR